VLAATALLGDRLAFAAPSIFLRSGCSLVPLREELAWVGYGGSVQSMELGVTDALGLFELAVHRADEVGFPWMTDPVLLEPGPELARLLEKSFFAADDRSEPSGAD
jgi:CRISPR-associated protein Csb1